MGARAVNIQEARKIHLSPTETDLKRAAAPVTALALILALAAALAGLPSDLTAGPAKTAVHPAERTDDTAVPLAKAAAAPVIDGVLDDAAWAAGLKFDGFKTFKPDFGKDASQKTEAYIAYDAENFYFAFRCFDAEPAKIKAAVSKRDNIFQDDVAFINIDTFNDRQSAFAFIVNPLGIQGDGMVDVQGNLSTSFDAVWYSKGRIDDNGWTVEARVPLKSIRFPNKEVLTWRILFIRFFTRTSEQVAFPPLDPNYGSLMGQAQPVQIEGLKYERVVELLPAFTFGRTEEASEAAQGALVRNEDLDINDLSLTGKLGLTSDLTLDATVNPDFSQVEADAGQVDFNLRYALYYEEKRPFFLEGSDLWQFGGALEDAPLYSLVYTRTIVDPAYGFKLSGKVTPRDTVAAIYARDNLAGDEVDVHPDIMIARYKHTLKDDSFLGAFYTGREYGPTRDPGATDTSTDHALSLYYDFSNRKVVVQLGYQDISEGFRADSGYLTRTGLRQLMAFGMYTFYPKSKFFQRVQTFYWSAHLFDTVYDMGESTNVFVLRAFLPRNTMVRIEGLLASEVFAGGRFSNSGFGFMFESQLAKSVYIQSRVRRMDKIFYDPADPYQGYGTTASAAVRYQPVDKLDFVVNLSYVDFYRALDQAKVYDYLILRSRNTFQINKYLFLRGIVEYNDFAKRMTLDGLVSFTYIPGTVVHLGYGSALEKVDWDEDLPGFVRSDRFRQMSRGFFFKVSYLWRL